MNNFCKISFLKIIIAMSPFCAHALLRCDLFFMNDPSKPAEIESLSPRIREYPRSIKIIDIDINQYSDGPTLPVEDLKEQLNITVDHHYSWIIPSFSQKLFFSLYRESKVAHFYDNAHPYSGSKAAVKAPISSDSYKSYSDVINKQYIGTMEIFSMKNNQIQCSILLSDSSYSIQVQDMFPIDQWIVIDTPYKTAILYISALTGN